MNWGRIKKKWCAPIKTHGFVPLEGDTSWGSSGPGPKFDAHPKVSHCAVPCDCGVGHYRHLRIAERPKHSVVPFLRLVENKNSKTW